MKISMVNLNPSFWPLKFCAVEVARYFFGSEMRYRSKTEAEYQRGGTGYVKESQH